MRTSKAWLVALAVAGTPAAALAQVDPPALKPAAAKPAKPPPQGRTVEGVTVTGTASDLQTSIDRRSYTLGKDLAATTGSIADALRNLPSVEVDLQGNLSLRGDPNVTIVVDGKPSPMFEGAGRADALQQLPADQIERVEVITNPSAALNPEGSGGVINLITKKSRGTGVTGSAYVTAGSAGLKRAGANFGYNSKTLAVTGSIAGNYQRNKQKGRDHRDAIDPVSGAVVSSEQDFVGRNIARGPTARLNATYTIDPKTTLSGGATYNELLIYGHPFNFFEDEAADGTPLGLLVRQGARRFLETDSSLTAGWKHSFAGEGHELSIDLVRNLSDPHDHTTTRTFAALPPTATPFERIRDDANQEHRELTVTYSRPLPGGAKLKTGYELKTDDNRFDFTDERGADAGSLTPVAALDNHFEFKQTVNAAYGTYERSFGDLNAQAGLRLEEVHFDLAQFTSGQRSSQDYTEAYPTLHLAYKLDDTQKLIASFSRRVQRPPPVLLNPLRYQIDPKTVQQGNADLKPTIIQSYELGYERREGQTYDLATFYYRQNQGAFTPVVIDLGNGVFETTYDNLGSSRAAGLELVANGRLSKTLTYNASGNFYWNEIDAGNLGIAGKRSTFGIAGRANLNWQVRPDDLVQVNAIAYGRRVYAQGFLEPFATLNLGWRHKVNDKVTATLTVQDPLASSRFVRSLDTPNLRGRAVIEPAFKAVVLRLDYRFGGGGKPGREPGFEYETAAPPPT